MKRSQEEGVRAVEAAVHFSLALLHGIAAIYHFRQRRYVLGSLHLAGVALDGASFMNHVRHEEKEVNDDDEEPLFVG